MKQETGVSAAALPEMLDVIYWHVSEEDCMEDEAADDD